MELDLRTLIGCLTLGIFFGILASRLLTIWLWRRSLDPIRRFDDEMAWRKLKEQGGVCALCREQLGHARRDFHADHAHPWSLGGRTDWDNLQVLCPSCNLSKGAKSS